MEHLDEIDLESLLVQAMDEMEEGVDAFTRLERRTLRKTLHADFLPALIGRLLSGNRDTFPALIVSLRSYGREQECEEAKRQHPDIWFEEKEALYKIFLEAIKLPPSCADWAILFLLASFSSIVLEHVTRRLNPDAELLRPPSAFVYAMQ
jgi:hypothetical protein